MPQFFRHCSDAPPSRLRSIPDGETGSRLQYTFFQREKLPQGAVKSLSGDGPLSQDEIAAVTKHFTETEMVTGYESAALESYETFKNLKAEGVIPSITKFQVGLPTIANVVGVIVRPEFQKAAAPFYEKALFTALARLQQSIPRDELAIQIDMGMDMYHWERLGKDVPGQEWFDDRSYVLEYITRMVEQVQDGVDLGLHFCYGDLDHQHFKEPESLAAVVDLCTQISAKSRRKAQWVHFPVPLGAMSTLDTYFGPIATLSPILTKDQTKLYLGLVHAGDLLGTERRIEVAGRYVQEFGVATECGLGRTPTGEIHDILNIMRQVSEPLET